MEFMKLEQMMRVSVESLHKARDGHTERRSHDDAVSSVIGTVLMVAVTVIVFGGVAALVFDQVNEAPDSQTATLVLAGRDAQSLVVTHHGGEPLPLDAIEIQIIVDGTRETVAASALAAQIEDGVNWVIGETVCIVGGSSLCLHPPGTVVSEVQVRFNNYLLLYSEPSGGA